MNDAGVPVCFEQLILPRIGVHRRPPLHAVQAARANLMKSTGLDPAPWQDVPEDVPILFYDRRGTGRRIWNNSQEVKDALEKDYHVSIQVIGQEWNKLSFTEQTSLFHAYPIIVAPHGAHLSNLMFGREGTTVIEIVCSEGVCPAKNWTPSLFTFTWFPSFSRQIPMDHIQIPVDDCPPGTGYSPKSFSVNLTTFVPCLVSHLKLKRKEPKLSVDRGQSRK